MPLISSNIFLSLFILCGFIYVILEILKSYNIYFTNVINYSTDSFYIHRDFQNLPARHVKIQLPKKIQVG